MRQCKIIHINDGNATTIKNGNWLLVEEYIKMEEIVDEYLKDGWEVKHIVPEYMPAEMEEGTGIPFYQSGVCIYLEKEIN